MSSQVFALSTQSTSISEQAKSADTILIGEIRTIESGRSRLGNIFSRLEISDASTISKDGLKAVGGESFLFVQGGLIINDFEKNSEHPYILSVIAGAPTFNTGDRIIVFVSGNGANELPFTSGSIGVLRIDKNGHISDSNGSALVRSNNGYQFMTNVPTNTDVRLVYSTSERPPIEGKIITKQFDSIKLEEFVGYLARFRENNSSEESSLISGYINPQDLSENFVGKTSFISPGELK